MVSRKSRLVAGNFRQGEKFMKLFVTGVNGQLGHDVVNEALARGYEIIGSDIQETGAGNYVQLDITNKEAVEKIIAELEPDVIVHCAAWTAVDLAEDEDKRDKVYAINADGTANIASVCKELDIPMVYISTDYVFNGEGTMPWEPDDRCFAPLNVYGQTKLQGELAEVLKQEEETRAQVLRVFEELGYGIEL